MRFMQEISRKLCIHSHTWALLAAIWLYNSMCRWVATRTALVCRGSLAGWLKIGWKPSEITHSKRKYGFNPISTMNLKEFVSQTFVSHIFDGPDLLTWINVWECTAYNTFTIRHFTMSTIYMSGKTASGIAKHVRIGQRWFGWYSNVFILCMGAKMHNISRWYGCAHKQTLCNRNWVKKEEKKNDDDKENENDSISKTTILSTQIKNRLLELHIRLIELYYNLERFETLFATTAWRKYITILGGHMIHRCGKYVYG